MSGERRLDQHVVQDLLDGLDVRLAEFFGRGLEAVVESSLLRGRADRSDPLALLGEVDQSTRSRS